MMYLLDTNVIIDIIANNAILVTNNTKHLSRLQGIQLENWAV